MKAEVTTVFNKKVFQVNEDHENVNKYVKAVIVNFGDERGDIIVKNDNFGTKRKYADFTNGKKEVGLHPLQIVFSGVDLAILNNDRYIDADGNVCQWKQAPAQTQGITMASEYTYKLITSNNIEIESYEGNATELVIPSEIDGYKVTSIGRWAFKNCESLERIEIPEGVTSIGNFAFHSCTNLESITIPGSVTSIGDFAFENCFSLERIMIPEGVTSIGRWAFENCKSLTSIELPESVTSIEASTFALCESLTSIEIPESVTSIGEDAFYNCKSLTSIEIPESVTSIGRWAFANCESLTSIEIPEGVTSIGDFAFFACPSLTSINASSDLKKNRTTCF